MNPLATTTTRRSKLGRTAVVLAAALCAACNQPEESLPLATPAALVAAESPAPVALPVSNPPDAKQPVEPKVDAPATGIANYEPPFPDRVELFVAPKRQGGQVKHDGGFEESVELLGFATVNEPRVVLSIAGQVASVPAGGAIYGIEVISIETPKVVLQRGRQRWQASLEN
ncbi:MAG: hypothetical protein KF847_12350 [Pirellulales bacterium]|nr:hypothetical protein [Pirellulales bacterium]